LGEDLEQLGAEIGHVGIGEMSSIKLTQSFFERLANLRRVEFDQLAAFHPLFERNHRMQRHFDRRIVFGPICDEFTQGHLAGDILFGEGGLMPDDSYDTGMQENERQDEKSDPIFANCFQHEATLQSNREAMGALRRLDTVGRIDVDAHPEGEIQPTRGLKMWDVVLEQSITIGAVGTVVAIATFYAWMQTGLRYWMSASIAIAAGTAVLVAIGWWIETDRENLRRFVYETAVELESNQHQKVVSKIHPQATAPLQEARLRLPELRFTRARIKSIHQIEIARHRTGKSATIAMNVYVELEQGERRGSAPRAAQLTLEQWDGEWMIVDFQHNDPHYYMLNQQGRSRLDAFRP
jgi:hypothetical protein